MTAQSNDTHLSADDLGPLGEPDGPATPSANAPLPGGAAPDRADTARPARLRGLLNLGERYSLLGLVIVIAVFFSLYPASSESFPTTANLSVLTGNQSVIMCLAVALLLPLIAGHFDFSVGAIAASSSVLCAALQSFHGASPWIYLPASVIFGTVIGLINGLMVSRLRMNSFVSTLGMATLLGGGIQWYTHGQVITAGVDPGLVGFGSDTWLGLPRVVFVVVALLLVIWYVLAQTPFGRSLYAIGSNARAAQLVGLPVQRHSALAFAAAGAIAGMAGILLTARTGGATADNGTASLFPALAAVFLGATAIQPGRFNVWGTVIGVLLVAISVSGLTLAGASDWVNPVFNGAALLIAVGLSSFLAGRRTTR